MKVLEELDKLFAEKKLPLKRQEIQNNQSVYQGTFMVRPNKRIPFGIVVVHGEGAVDFQIAYKRIGYLTNYADKARVLELINELNMGKSFYYTVCLNADGEIMMKTMAKTTEDVRPLYEMLIVGSNVLRHVVEQIEKIIPPEE
ncbi:hypothetical protein [Jeotgalibaca caeni]|uniref:hypothetical protein n=1 Tax=Jeotgalibaca caeni TaxID=3028623 RepID=UPI00237DD75D|nr:hypothetical protein [Jeotgalibaca caeni]MDE1548044.1 hypothetical protein [Jeotgalibaca caeni]